MLSTPEAIDVLLFPMTHRRASNPFRITWKPWPILLPSTSSSAFAKDVVVVGTTAPLAKALSTGIRCHICSLSAKNLKL